MLITHIMRLSEKNKVGPQAGLKEVLRKQRREVSGWLRSCSGQGGARPPTAACDSRGERANREGLPGGAARAMRHGARLLFTQCCLFSRTWCTQALFTLGK